MKSTQAAALNSALAPLVEMAPGQIRDDNTQTALLAPRGEHPHQLGVQVVDAAALERLAASLNAARRDIVIDYDHSSFSGAPAQRQAAGWILANSARVTDAGLVAEIRWTVRAAEMIRAGEYRYLSPVLLFDPVRRQGGRQYITGLFNAALTNNPNIGAMTPLSNETTVEQKETPMNELAEIAKTLGLPENAAANDIAGALAKQRAGLAALLNALGAADVDAAQRRITELSAPPAVTAEEAATMRAELDIARKERAARAVDAAVEQGKLTPAQRAWAENYMQNDAVGFAKWLETAPVVAPVLPSGAKTERPANAALNDLDRSVISSLGITEEQFKAAQV